MEILNEKEVLEKHKGIVANSLINDDCFNIFPTIEDKSVDLILTDPPYNTTNLTWDKALDLDLMWKHLTRIIKDNGAIILFGKQPFTSKLVLSNQEWFKYELVWEKTRVSNSMQLKKQPAQIHENILVFYKNQPTYNDLKFKVDEKYVDKRKNVLDSFYHGEGHYSGVMHRKADDGYRHPQSILPFNSVWEKGMHPTQKPVPLLEWLIRSYSNDNDLVMDFTMGSGSTCVACLNTDRHYIGIEKDKGYFKKAEERINKTKRELENRLW